MSATAIIIVVVGIAMILTRGPLLVAPIKTRDTYKLLFNTDVKMRAIGVIMGGFGVLCIWVVMGVPGTAATVIRYVAGFVLILSLISMIPFPAFSRNFGTNVWNSFGSNTLRVMGAGSVLVGALLVYYGFGL